MPTEAASTLAPMATFNRDDAGVWTVTLEPGDSPERNLVFDATVPRYLTLFDPAFLKAEKDRSYSSAKDRLFARRSPSNHANGRGPSSRLDETLSVGANGQRTLAPGSHPGGRRFESG
jgi:hypothetical protein